MKAMDRKALLAAKIDLPQETVEVPELGGSVIVRGMTGKEQTSLYKGASKNGAINEDVFAARLIAQCLVDKQGNRLLEDAEYVFVQQWLGALFNRVAAAAMRVNGLAQRGN